MWRTGLVRLACACFIATTGHALAVSQDIEASALDIVPDNDPSPGPVWIRYYRPGHAVANAGGAGVCSQPGYTWDDRGGNQRFCAGEYRPLRGSVRGHRSNLFNYGDAPNGTRMFSTFGFEQNSGTSLHVGYYAWSSDVANTGDLMVWHRTDCSGESLPIACIGHALVSDAVGTDQLDVPNGPIAPFGSMRPIPVPRVTGVSPATAPDTIQLAWDAAVESGGSGSTASYVLFWASDDAGDGACDRPTEAELTNRLNTVPIAGTSTTVDVATDLGLTVGSDACVTFGLQIEYANLGVDSSTAVRSRFLSANSQAVYLGSGGLAADIVGLRARPIGVTRDGLRVHVSWSTALEDGVHGFHVARATAPGGPFERVSELIPARGEPSAYDVIDLVPRTGARRGLPDLYYRIETIDIDDSQSRSGAVRLSVPGRGVPRYPRPLRRR